MLALLGVLAAGGCLATTEEHYVDFPDIDVAPPSAEQLEAWRTHDPWRADPLRVAHEELLLRMEVPWRGQPFLPERYEFHESNPEHPEWGSYVVRGYQDAAGRTFRYRVKLGREGGLWFVRQFSHFIITRLPHPALEGHGDVH